MDNVKLIAELQRNCKKYRDEAIALRSKPAVLTHVLRRCMEQIGTGSRLYADCLAAIEYIPAIPAEKGKTP